MPPFHQVAGLAAGQQHHCADVLLGRPQVLAARSLAVAARAGTWGSPSCARGSRPAPTARPSPSVTITSRLGGAEWTSTARPGRSCCARTAHPLPRPSPYQSSHVSTAPPLPYRSRASAAQLTPEPNKPAPPPMKRIKSYSPRYRIGRPCCRLRSRSTWPAPQRLCCTRLPAANGALAFARLRHAGLRSCRSCRTARAVPRRNSSANAVAGSRSARHSCGSSRRATGRTRGVAPARPPPRPATRSMASSLGRSAASYAPSGSRIQRPCVN